MSLPARVHERGQVIVIAAILLPVLLAMAGMAVDVGSYASERRSLQNAADSIALAAGQELPDATAAQTKAAEYANDHGVDPSNITVTVTGGTTTPRVRVVIDRSHDFIFMGIVGIENADVGAVASAGKFSFGGGAGVVPWSIEEQTVLASASGDEVTIKYDSSGPAPGQGNFGAIRIDGSGSSDYEASAKYGSNYNICSTGMSNCTTGSCPGTYPSGCAEDAPECDGPDCAPKTGNMTGPTRDAVDFRVANTDSACDTFDEAFSLDNAFRDAGVDPNLFSFDGNGASTGGRLGVPNTDTPTKTPTNTPTKTPTPSGPTNTPTKTNTPGPTSTPVPPTATHTPISGPGDTYRLNGACNPWAAGSCATNTSVCSRRVFLIPIVDSFGNGSSDPVTIKGFALVFLEGYSGSCAGSSCDIQARFVKADITTGAFAGTYDPNGYNHFVKLVE
jgi:hypothetical protein